jgi:ABC-type glycerol-3-phosphate transport system substrate-binding protein
LPQTIRRLAPIALLLAVLAAGLVISACGGNDKANADSTLKETFSGKKSVDSGKLNLSFRAELKAKSASAQAQVGEPVSVSVTGPFQNLGKDALPAMNLDLKQILVSCAGVASQQLV